MFASLQENFSRALLDPERPVPHALTSHSARVPEKRFAVYRNNVAVGLVNALAARFPATQRIVGEEFFRAMAQLYVRARPPCSRLLMVYGDGFADFIADFEPASELAYLADVARLEAARTRAYHAADALPVDPKILQLIKESQLGELCFEAHPSAEIVRSMHPIVTIWSMNAGEREPGEIEDWVAEDALVVRPQFDVFVRLLPPGGAVFLSLLFGGTALGDAVAAAEAAHKEFNLAANLAGLLASGACTRIIVPD
jgi:hypothetical protein